MEHLPHSKPALGLVSKKNQCQRLNWDWCQNRKNIRDCIGTGVEIEKISETVLGLVSKMKKYQRLYIDYDFQNYLLIYCTYTGVRLDFPTCTGRDWG